MGKKAYNEVNVYTVAYEADVFGFRVEVVTNPAQVVVLRPLSSNGAVRGGVQNQRTVFSAHSNSITHKLWVILACESPTVKKVSRTVSLKGSGEDVTEEPIFL